MVQGLESNCNKCSTEIRNHLLNCTWDRNRHKFIHENRKTQYGTLVEYFCPNCKSRVRSRGIFELINNRFDSPKYRPFERGLLVSCGEFERKLFGNICESYRHISLQGQHGDPICEEGIDITMMPQVKTGGYDLYFAMVVWDYIPAMKKAIEEAARVLKAGAQLIVFIQPWRVNDGVASPEAIHFDALNYENYASKNDKGETGIPDIRVGHDWLHQELRKYFRMEKFQFQDPISPIKVEFLTGIRK